MRTGQGILEVVIVVKVKMGYYFDNDYDGDGRLCW